ncbi:MAG: DegT/DnrJ/EryC1/StrS family aminotransferase [candidate division WOR-3 bacterium]|nr:DegT/DnrJ/EryC1/StrS family aminotransferase [candidate division WOR-3 bacterium]
MIPHSKPTITENDIKSVSEVMRSGYIAQGEKVQEFEEKLASFIGVKSGIATSSGTSALHLALMVLGVGKEDEVILPTYVCTAPLNAVYYTGAKPIFADINEDDFNISAKDVERKLTKKTKAIIVPHMFGLPTEMEKILRLEIPVIQDCAQSIGATVLRHQASGIRHSVPGNRHLASGTRRPVGSLGTLSIYSFYATKLLATGEGGMVLSNDEELLSRIQDLRDYDEKDDFRVRFNYKMSDIEAAFGLSQLVKLPSFIKRRKEIARKYSSVFRDYDFIIPSVYEDREHIFYRYVVRVHGKAEEFIEDIQNKGIECRRPVYKPLHHYLSCGDFPVADKVYESAVSIPIYPSLSDEDVDYIIETVGELCKVHR